MDNLVFFKKTDIPNHVKFESSWEEYEIQMKRTSQLTYE